MVSERRMAARSGRPGTIGTRQVARSQARPDSKPFGWRVHEMRAKRTAAALIAAFMLAAGWSPPASAQITTGTVSGSLKDVQGATVPGATVSLVSAARGTSTETVTDTNGNFTFPNVTPGTYTVRITMSGFKSLERPGIVVSPGDRVLVPTLTI
jgi:protocatechuate 3,4-dioxygenase beta subunit